MPTLPAKRTLLPFVSNVVGVLELRVRPPKMAPAPEVISTVEPDAQRMVPPELTRPAGDVPKLADTLVASICKTPVDVSVKPLEKLLVPDSETELPTTATLVTAPPVIAVW